MSKRNSSNFADRLLEWFIKPEFLEEVLGDLYEYRVDLSDLPLVKRTLFFWFHVFNMIRPSMTKSLVPKRQKFFFEMINFNSKLAFRTLTNNKLISVISLVCLILGSLCFQLIYSWFYNEISTDKFHNNLDRIYMGTARTNPMADLSSVSLKMMFQLDFAQLPEVEKNLLLHVYGKDEIKFVSNKHEFNGKALIVDSAFFDFFDFELANGSNDLKDPSNVLITKSFANKVFGKSNPIGKNIDIKCDQEGTYKVVGVLENIPSNSSIYFDFLVPRHSQRFWRRIPTDLILTAANFDITALNKKVAFMGRETNQRFPESLLSFVSLSDLYFDHAVDTSLLSKYGSVNNIYTMIFIATMIWLITLLGFNNLQSTLQLSSAKKYGIKQIIGATKGALTNEIILIRFYMLVIGVVVSFVLFQIVFPYYSSFMEFNIDHNPLNDFVSMLIISTLFILISTIISSIQIRRIKTNEAVVPTTNLFKISKLQRILVVFQYAITIVLMISTSVVYIQYDYMSQKDSGIKSENIASVDFFEIQASTLSDEQQSSFDFVKNSLSQSTIVKNFSQGDMPIGSMVNSSSWKRADSGFEYSTANVMTVDPNYDDLLDIELTMGRFFSDSLDKSRQQKVVINEAAMRMWQINDITKTKLSSNTSGRQEYDFDVIGVVKDFHYQHLSNEIKPLVLLFRPYQDESFMVEFSEGNQQAGLDFLEKLFQKVNPMGNFNYDLLSVEILEQYKAEERLGKVYFAFTIVALFLSSLCLIAFSFYETQRRTKEVGIRKVNGATAKDIFGLLSFSFIKMIFVSIIIAVPVSWYLVQNWMDGFAYRANIGWWMYMLVGLFAISAALLATAWQTLQVSKRNPITSLRYE